MKNTNLINFPKRCNMTTQRRLQNMLAVHLDSKSEEIGKRALILNLKPGTEEFKEYVRMELDAEAQEWQSRLGLSESSPDSVSAVESDQGTTIPKATSSRDDQPVDDTP